MRILFTGASSVTGSHVLKRILESAPSVEIWCVRHHGDIATTDSRIRVIDLDLAEAFDSESLPDTIDMVIHFANVTHAYDPERYSNVNLGGTTRLAKATRTRGCARFVYISTRCATVSAGAYGESKLAAENKLKELSWDSLLMIRPSEIYGCQGNEGVDKLIALARQWHVTPLLFGNPNISFAPISVDDFAMIAAEEILTSASGVRTIELCGPEDLSGSTLAKRIAKRYRALPVPLWWPLFALFLKIAVRLNFDLSVPDQLERLTCAKTSSARNADRTGRARFLIDN